MNKILLNEPFTKAQCVSWFVETKSDLQTQRNLKKACKYGRDPLSRPSIRAWHKKFMETETVFDKGRRTSEENIDHVRNRVSF